MVQATTIRGGKIHVYLGNNDNPIVYKTPCGLSSRSISLEKGTSDERIPDCDDPDKVDWLGRNATSLSMDIDGEGVLAAESVDIWLDATEAANSVPAKVEWEFPAKTITWTGKMMVSSFKVNANNGEIAKASVAMKSDGQMVRTKTPATPNTGE